MCDKFGIFFAILSALWFAGCYEIKAAETVEVDITKLSGTELMAYQNLKKMEEEQKSSLKHVNMNTTQREKILEMVDVNLST